MNSRSLLSLAGHSGIWWPPVNMFRQVNMALLHFFCSLLFLCMTVITACEFNNCFCNDEESIIMCGYDDASQPHFTFMERFFAKELFITEKQTGLIQNLCLTFPSIGNIYYTGSTCPLQVNCGTVICE